MATKLRHKQQEPPLERVRERVSSAHHRLGSAPIILFFLGGLVLVLWLSGTIVQIQTSEYLALGATQQVAGVAWSVLAQPYLMITGQAPAGVVTSWAYGWIVEVLTLVVALALTAAYVKVASMNPILAKGFLLSAGVLLVLNSWADFQSSPGASPLIRVLVALAIGLIVTVGLPLGIGLIEHGIEEYR